MSKINTKPAVTWLINGLSGLVGLGMPDVIDTSDAPSGDLSLDDIFGDTSNPSTTVVAAPEPPASTTTSDEPFIKAKTGTVYKTREEAELGIARKDALIDELRAQVRTATGNDPLRKNEPKPVDYTQEHDKYFEDIADAVQKKDTAAYMKAQQKLFWDTLGPVAPTLISLSRANAERVVSEQYPEFRGFLQSEEFQALNQDSPLLADAIRQAEQNPTAASQLPELYKVAYLTTQGRRVPELIQSATRNATQVQARPTVHSTPATPPPNNGRQAAQPTLDNSEGRKAIIAQMEGKGVMDLKW